MAYKWVNAYCISLKNPVTLILIYVIPVRLVVSDEFCDLSIFLPFSSLQISGLQCTD